MLKKGQITPRPVQTRMGWHVVQLEDTRDSQPPPFDKVQNELQKFVLTKKLAKASDDLLKTAKVDPPLTTDAVKELNAAAPAAPAAPASPSAPAPAPSDVPAATKPN
jgi:peptidyl-prolyl cis-trans isomerase C